MSHDLTPGTFFTITRPFSNGDRVTILLPMHFNTQRWPHGGISIERGPLAYSLKIEEDWQVVTEESHHLAGFPAWNLYPASRWNYALDLDETALDQQIEIVERGDSDDPWSIQSAPIELHVPARRVLGWGLARKKAIKSQYEGPEGFKIYHITGDFVFTPQLPSPKSLSHRLGKKVEKITLVPYGCTKLRITIFPNARGGIVS